MITKTLSEFVSPIIENAMATGGRSSTTETTNYGTIGDAIFKNAQMNMNVAQMKAERDLGVANIRAQNELQIIDLKRADADRHQQRVDAAKPMGDMEKAMGTLQGIATGAVTGFAVGGVPGAVIGGVAGGAMQANTYYGPGGHGQQDRETGQRNQQMMNGIATTAVSLKGMYNTKKSSDVLNNAQKALSGLNDASMRPGADRDAMQAQRQGIIAKATGEMAKYMGPQEALTAGKSLGDNSATGIFDNDPKRAAAAKMALNGVSLAALDPSDRGTPAAARKILADQQQQMGIFNDFDPKKRMSGVAMQNWTNSKNPKVSEGLFGAQDSSPLPNGINTMRGRQAGPASSANQSYSQQSTAPAQTQQRAPMAQAAPQQSAPGIPQNFVNTPPVGVGAPGIAMDDGMNFLRDPVGAIEKTNSMGAEAVHALGQGQEKMGVADKIQHNMALSENEFEQNRIPLNQDHNKVPEESQRVKDFRNGTGESLKAAVQAAPDEVKHYDDKIAVVNQRIELAKLKAHNSGYASPESSAKVENGSTASSSVDEMIKLVKGKDFPAGNRFKAIAMEVRSDGIKMQGPAAATAGIGTLIATRNPSAAGAAGAAAGYAAKDLKVGKGSGIGLSDKEERIADHLKVITQDFKQAYNKMQEPGTMKEHEEEMMDGLLVDGRFSRESILAKLYAVKEHIAMRMENTATVSEGTREGQIRQTSREANIRAAADINKTEAVTRSRYRTMMQEKMQAEQQPEVDLTGTGLIPLN